MLVQENVTRNEIFKLKQITNLDEIKSYLDRFKNRNKGSYYSNSSISYKIKVAIHPKRKTISFKDLLC